MQTDLLTSAKKSPLDLAISQHCTQLLIEYCVKIWSGTFVIKIEAIRDSFVGREREKAHFVWSKQLQEETGIIREESPDSLLMLGLFAGYEEIFFYAEGVFLCFKYHLHYTCQNRAR